LGTVAINVALVGLYVSAGRFGLSLAFVHSSVTAVWPPTGLSLAALLLFGYRVWPGILLGAFFVNEIASGNVLTSIAIALGNTLEAVAGAWLLNRFAGGRDVFERTRNIWKFVLLAAILSTVISASVGVTMLCLGHFAAWENYSAIWITWWLGDMVGVIIVTPFLVVWSRKPTRPSQPAWLLETVLLLLLLVLMGDVVFFQSWLPSQGKNYPLEYLTLLPLVWAAFRFKQPGASLAAFIMSGIALQGTLRGFGPFALSDQNQSLLLLQAFMGTITVTALVLAAVVSERARVEQFLRVEHGVSRVLAEASTVNEAARKILQSISETAGWETGAIWFVDKTAGELRCVETWHVPKIRVPEFEAATRSRTFTKGVGLPGRIWASGAPTWISDVTQDQNFPRGEIAAREGLHAAFGFPIRLGDDILGVIEFFSRQIRQPDDNLLQMVAVLGSQIGQFHERKRAENALRDAQAQLQQHAEELEDRVVERTQELKETIQSLESFSYSIAHDLRAPLRALQGFTKILLTDYAPQLDAAAQGYAERIVRAATRMDELIQDLLLYGRLSHVELGFTRIRLEDQIDKALAQLLDDVQAKKAELHVVRPMPEVWANSTVLQQVLINLIGNALKFVPPNIRPHVELKTETKDKFVRLTIRDNGIGIKPEHQERIFNVFERLHTEVAYPGTGIGLAIVRRGIERMKGRVGLESTPGQGSCFWLELPRPHD
jgi:signal transduction histidine kinase/integral membrane sensor domain MASE1